MLILSDTNALGVDFDKFRQGIHESSAYRDGSADGDILVGEFVASYLRGTVNGGTVFADDEDRWGLASGGFPIARGGRTAPHRTGRTATHSGSVRGCCQAVGNKFLGFAAGGAVADGNGFDVVVLDHLEDVHGGLHAVVDRRVGEDGLVVQQRTLSVETHYLATRAEARVDSHHTLLSQWG